MVDRPTTEAQKVFPGKQDKIYRIGQYVAMGMWYVEVEQRTTIALATTEYQANRILEAFEQQEAFKAKAHA